MGVINLGTLVDKIRKKLSGTFIKTTDYATDSAAGIVKVGSNIDVTSDGTISVTFPASGGMTVDELWSGTLTTDFADITSALAHPISDYKFLALNHVNGVNVTSSQLIYVPKMSTGASNQNFIYFENNITCTIRLGDTVTIKGSTTTTGATLIGIK